jgi:hypothetical protein
MPKPQLIALCCLLFVCATTTAQQDSTLESLQQLPLKYISKIDSKVDKYSKRITSKTTKTLEKLSRLESKIQNILQKVNPDAAARLFNNQITFSSLLQQIKQGEATVLQYQQQYDQYRDQLTTGLKYIEQQKETLDSAVLKKIAVTRKKVQELNEEEDKNAAMQQFIKERKKQLITTAFQFLGKNKYLSKINKEIFYYGKTLENYREIFRDERKAEQTAKTILNKIPAFQKFLQKNSMLAQLFGQPGDEVSTANLAGLQTRASVQSLIQGRISAAGSNAQQLISQNIQAAQSELSKLKDKMLNSVQGNDTEIPEFDFTPKTAKTKTFLQRLEYGSNFQMGKSNSLMPATMDLALTVGYKLGNKSVAGIGAGYKLGLGTIDNIRFSNQGMSLRSFIDWKLKKQFFISGGMEMNYLSHPEISSFPAPSGGGREGADWQQAALLGLTKKMSIKTKWFKETKLQLLYDFLSKQHLPVSQPVVFRVGYNF